MAWSSCLVWPEICAGADEYNEDQVIEDDSPLLPDNWGPWRATLAGEIALQERMRGAGYGALLAYYTEGLEASQIEWVSPHELARASSALRELVFKSPDDPLALQILECYEDVYPSGKPLPEAFCDDLDVMVRTALEAARLGHNRVTLAFNY